MTKIFPTFHLKNVPLFQFLPLNLHFIEIIYKYNAFKLFQYNLIPGGSDSDSAILTNQCSDFVLIMTNVFVPFNSC